MKLRNVALAFVVSSSVCAAGQIARVKGTVSDSMGAVISKAYVRIRLNTFSATAGKNQRRPSEVTLNTDRNGRFQVNLIPGFYDVCVHFPAFAARCKTLVVRANRPAKLDIKLDLDPEITAEFGDDFGSDYVETIPSEAPEHDLKN